MNQALIDNVVQAVLYEGYNLYPYRPSVKSRQRWTFGGLYPRPYSDAHAGSDAWSVQTECLIEGDPSTMLTVQVRFLHLTERRIGRLPRPLAALPEDGPPHWEAVEALQVGATLHQAWQEAVQREVAVPETSLGELVQRGRSAVFSYPAGRAFEPLAQQDGRIVGLVIRQQAAVQGSIELSAQSVQPGLFRLTARVQNDTPLENAENLSRDEAQLSGLMSTHTVLAAREGRFVSLIDPPEPYRLAAAACSNLGAWPVLVGEPGQLDAMLSSPIILYDYPQIAPESPGDLFDGTEIDEILTLRILTLTEEEQQAARGVDDRTRTLLDRTQALARQQLAGLHGAVRWLEPAADPAFLPSPLAGEGPGVRGLLPQATDPNSNDHADDDPFAPRPTLSSVWIGDVELRAGDRVWLRPKAGGDILDLALADRTATIESIEQDFEDRVYLAVVLDDDPGRDLGQARQPGHRFFFTTEEVLPLVPSLEKTP